MKIPYLERQSLYWDGAQVNLLIMQFFLSKILKIDTSYFIPEGKVGLSFFVSSYILYSYTTGHEQNHYLTLLKPPQSPHC